MPMIFDKIKVIKIVSLYFYTENSFLYKNKKKQFSMTLMLTNVIQSMILNNIQEIFFFIDYLAFAP